AVPRNVSTLSLKKYFAYCYIPAPRTIYENVWKLPGGHSLSYDLVTGELRVFKYWDFVIEPEDSRSPPPSKQAMIVPESPSIAGRNWKTTRIDSLCEQIRESLERAVKRRLMSDVPLGVFLSGGVDSSAIAAFASKHVAAGSLNTFSIGFTEPSFDESAF